MNKDIFDEENDPRFQEQLHVSLTDQKNARAKAYLNYQDAIERVIEIGQPDLGYDFCRDVSGAQNKRLIAEVQDWVTQNTKREGRNAVFLDSTTIFAVRELLFGKTGATPELLFDLSNFVNAVTLFDQVFYLENPNIDSPEFDLNEAIGGNEPIVKAIPIHSAINEFGGYGEFWDGVSSNGVVLTGIWKNVRDHLDWLGGQPVSRQLSPIAAEFRDEIRRYWELLLEMPLPDSSKLFREWSYKWDSPVQDLLASSYDILSSDLRVYGYSRSRSEEKAYELANECNQRSLFNLHVAHLLNLPYLPGWARMPYRKALYRRAWKANEALASAQFLDEKYREKALRYATSEISLHLPFFVSAALAEAKSLPEFCAALGRIRRMTTPFRQHRAEYDHAVTVGDQRWQRNLKKVLEGESKHICSRLSTMGKATFIGACIASGAVLLGIGEADVVAWGVILSGATHGAIHGLGEKTLEGIKERLLRPDYWCLVNVNEAAEQLTNAICHINRLWKVTDITPEEYVRRFDRMRKIKYA